MGGTGLIGSQVVENLNAAGGFVREFTQTKPAGHFVVLSIVGVDKVPGVDYLRAKVLQEAALKEGPIQYSIVRATQFMEAMDATLAMTTRDGTVHLPSTPIQPIAAANVSSTVSEIAAGNPLNGVLNVVGPDVCPLDELGRLTLTTKRDDRSVVTDANAGMWATAPGNALTAPDNARIAPTHYTDWLVS
jgi:uncharacterized protein YbjT (DUF2867 family)